MQSPFSVLSAENDSIIVRGDHPDFVFISTQCFSNISCDRAILIARSPSDLPTRFSCPRAVAVIDSANTSLRQAVCRQKIPTLTCGRSDTDTFTLTSLTDDSAMISLSRSICAFDDHNVEPFELPVSFLRPIDPFELMAASAVFCLLGKQNPLYNQEAASTKIPIFFATKINAFTRKNLQL